MRQILLGTALIYLVLSVAGCNTAPEDSFNIESIKNYKNIPGVTAEEIAAIETLKTKRKSFSYGHVTETEAFMLPDGTYAGFTYKFCGLLTSLFDIKFAPEHCAAWDYLKGSFDQKSIDFIGEMTPTPERMRFYYMTHAIAERSLRIFTHKDSDKIKTESDVNGLTLGFLSGTITADYVRKSYPVSFEAVNVSNFADVAEKLASGKIDAFVAEAIADPAFEEYDFIVSREFFPLVYSPVSLATANPELAPIISVVNKYLTAGGINRLHELYQEGDYDYIKYKLNKSFTKEEKDYLENLAAHGAKVRIALETDNYPVSFYNEKDDEFQGIAIDVLKEVSNLTGLKFESMTTKDTAWAEILEKLKSGEISMVTELIYSESREKDYIWANKPLISSYYALLSKTKHPDLMPYQVINATVGAMSESVYETMYNTWFPNNKNLIIFATQNKAFDALEKDEIDLLMTTEIMLLTQLNFREKPGYKINVRFNTPIDALFGFNKNELILRSIIDKTQIYVDTKKIANSWTNRAFDYSKKLANQQATFLLAIVIILLSVLAAVVFLLLKNKRLSKDLERQTEEAQVASKAKSVFLARMSHEIRTPLNAVIGMSNIAKNSITNKDKVISSINQIIVSSNHLLSILNDVLDMSKIESGKLELTHKPFSLLEAYGEVSGIITQRCLEKNINFVTNINEMKNITLIGDKLRINQVLINLLGNAVKFTDNAGEIKFEVSILEENDKKILLGYSISDNGIGMSAEQKARLFIPFEQADNSISARFGGTGLGLSISQNLVNMMGGEIKVESKPNAGSKFHFEISFEKGVYEAEAPPTIPDAIDLTGKRILLVEDIDINRIIICECLSATGVEIHEAENGRQAVDIFVSSPSGYYDLIYMDVQMPVLDGYEATREIRALEREDAKKVPIIAMTANAYKEDINDALAAGMNGHLAKPVDIDALMKSLDDFIIMKDKMSSK